MSDIRLWICMPLVDHQVNRFVDQIEHSHWHVGGRSCYLQARDCLINEWEGNSAADHLHCGAVYEKKVFLNPKKPRVYNSQCLNFHCTCFEHTVSVVSVMCSLRIAVLHYCSVLALYPDMYVCKYMAMRWLVCVYMCMGSWKLTWLPTTLYVLTSAAVILLQANPIHMRYHPSGMPLQPVGTHLRACLNWLSYFRDWGQSMCCACRTWGRVMYTTCIIVEVVQVTSII